MIQHNLKWNNHIDPAVTKAFKRLHILRVLSRAGVGVKDSVTIYTSLIRSALEYCIAPRPSLLPLSVGRTYSEMRFQDYRTCTFIQRSSPNI